MRAAANNSGRSVRAGVRDLQRVQDDGLTGRPQQVHRYVY